jgi:hypothetical protein
MTRRLIFNSDIPRRIELVRCFGELWPSPNMASYLAVVGGQHGGLSDAT